MGYIVHETAIATTVWHNANAAIEAFRKEIAGDEELAPLLLGPAGGCNGHFTYVFASSGGKSGFDLKNKHEAALAGFIKAARADGADVVHIRYGADEECTTVVYSSDESVVVITPTPKAGTP